jgi:uncharacterized membrane protein YphA (DoxX/SURF4 family)
VTDVLEHMLPGGQLITQDHISPSVSSLDGLAATSFGIFVQTICPVLLAVGLFTRLAALALLVQLLVLQIPGHGQLAPYSVALLAWVVVLGPGPLSLDGMFRPGMGTAALPLVGLFSRGLTGLTKRIGPVYALLLRLWIAAGLAAIALGGVKGLNNMLPACMAASAMAWLPQMSGMAAGLAGWALLTLAAPLALGLFTRVVALLLIVLIPTGMLSSGGDIGWITLLNLPLLGLPLLHGAGGISLDHAIAAAFRRRFPPFETLPAAAVARLWWFWWRSRGPRTAIRALPGHVARPAQLSSLPAAALPSRDSIAVAGKYRHSTPRNVPRPGQRARVVGQSDRG